MFFIFVPKLPVQDTKPQKCQKALAERALSFPTATARKVSVNFNFWEKFLREALVFLCFNKYFLDFKPEH